MPDTDSDLLPYTLEVIPPSDRTKDYTWAIRLRGKIYQRSDRGYREERKCRADGITVVQRLKAPGEDKW